MWFPHSLAENVPWSSSGPRPSRPEPLLWTLQGQNTQSSWCSVRCYTSAADLQVNTLRPAAVNYREKHEFITFTHHVDTSQLPRRCDSLWWVCIVQKAFSFNPDNHLGLVKLGLQLWIIVFTRLVLCRWKNIQVFIFYNRVNNIQQSVMF